MTGFAYEMPFGTVLESSGRVRFRLWAPAEDTVLLLLPDQGRRIPMTRAGDGWFSLTTDLAKPGNRYSFELSDGLRVPDPASRAQDCDPDGPSIVVDPGAYPWRHADWRGRPWTEAVLYELHVGTFSPEGTFDGVRQKLAQLGALGITAIELMPVSDFSGAQNWGYDGVLPFAPDAHYGTPDDLKALIDAAHEHQLIVLLDVVYNHFGPEGNYLGRYAPEFFTDRHRTPWGMAIDFTRAEVRDYFMHNALYWLEEYRFDGLRFDAVHAIFDETQPDILHDLAQAIRNHIKDREIHLVLENDNNHASLLTRDAEGKPIAYTAQWNDDFHHAAHTLLTGETAGYYMDYAQEPVAMLGRALAEGFAYQGEASAYRDGAPRGEPTDGLPPDAFVNFLQNHDQIGNRAFGDRLTSLAKPEALRAFTALHLLAPTIPMLFMGEEWGTMQPFQFFCSFKDGLADAVRKGRIDEFSRFPEFATEEGRAALPDPGAPETFQRSKLDWPDRANEHLAWTKTLLALRTRVIVPITKSRFQSAQANPGPDGLLAVFWRYAAGRIALTANLSDHPAKGPDELQGRILFTTDAKAKETAPPWFVAWSVSDASAA